MRFKPIACVLLGVFLSNLNDAVVFRFTNLVCLSHNESWFIFHHCRLKAVNRDRVIMNLNGTILYPANKIHVHGKMYKKASGFKPWVIDTKIDICRFMRHDYDPFAKMVFSFYKEFTNFNHTCPYAGLQIVKGFYLRPELLLLPFPTGEYMLSMRWSFDHKLQFDTNVSFLFVEDLRTN